MLNIIKDWLLSEQERWLLWVPVVMACGVLAFFALDENPSYRAGISMVSSGALALVFWRRWPWVRAVLLILFLFGLGFTAAQWQAERLRQPLLSYGTPVLPLIANLDEIIEADGAQKLVLSEIEVEGGTRIPIPDVIRLSLRKPDPKLCAGQRIRLRGGMFPLPEPAIPNGFDFAQYFYFKGIGAVGFAVPPVEVLDEGEGSGFIISLSNFRADLSQRVQSAIHPHFGTTEAAIATALITGDRAGIPEDAKEAMRASGLAHMLAISGLHLGLVSGVLYVLFRYILLFIPGLALRFPIKKWAAIGALLGALGYLTLAGFPVSAQRAYAMVALVLIAVIIDRQVYPMRSLALAAILILLIDPAAVTGPSFQLSFAATMAVIALFEAWRNHRRNHQKPQEFHRIGHKAMLYFCGVTGTTLVASLITAPFVVYHFNQFTLYHLLANVAASPIFSFLVMPSAVGGVLLMPLGLEQLFLWLMGQGVEWVLAIAMATESLPHSMLHVPTPPLWALGIVVLGACWLCFWQSRPRWLGVPIILAGLIPFFTTSLPDILISAEGAQIAVRLESGAYAMVKGSKRNFKASLWQEALGIEGFADTKKKDAEAIPLELYFTPKGGDALRLIHAGKEYHFSFNDYAQTIYLTPDSLHHQTATTFIDRVRGERARPRRRD